MPFVKGSSATREAGRKGGRIGGKTGKKYLSTLPKLKLIELATAAGIRSGEKRRAKQAAAKARLSQRIVEAARRTEYEVMHDYLED